MNIQGENKTQNRIYSLLPLWIVVGIFMIGPLLVMAVVSLMESNVYGGVHFKFSLSGYRQILFDTSDLGKYKVYQAKEKIRKIYKQIKLTSETNELLINFVDITKEFRDEQIE